MKAIKIYNIKWNFGDLTEEMVAEKKAKLPNIIMSKVNDDFNVALSVPVILEKKCGYPVISFSSETYRIASTIEGLLQICNPNPNPEKDKFKMLFTSRGALSAFGFSCFENFKTIIKNRIALEEKGVPASKMSAISNEAVLSAENLTHLDWETDCGEIIQEIAEIIKRKNDNAGFDSDYEDSILGL